MSFLTFESFISTGVLIVFYYLGAIVLPVVLWLLLIWLLRKYQIFGAAYEAGKEIAWAGLNGKHKIQLAVFFVLLFLFMELFWRMLFEFLIAYMQMRDALMQLQL